MAYSNSETIEIREKLIEDGKKHLKSRELYIDGCRRAAITQTRNGGVKFRFDVIGAFDWQEAKVWLLGLLELSTHAEELENDKRK